MRRTRLLYRSVRHTRPSQLRARLLYLVKRRALERFAPVAVSTEAIVSPGDVPPIRDDPPGPIFPARTDRIDGSGPALRGRFQNQARPLVPPVDWHPTSFAFGDHLAKMELHYMEYLEAVDDDAFHALVRDWIDSNPPYGRGYWHYVWNSFSVSIRLVVWMQQLAARAIDPRSSDGSFMLRSTVAQLRFLEHNLEVDLGGNHLVKNIKALLWAGRLFGGEDGARWGGLGRRLLLDQIDEQVLPDGVHFERSPAYHGQVLADLLECYAVLPDGPARDALGDALDRMAQATADLAHPDGTIALFNDGGLAMAYPPETLLRVHRALRGSVVRPRRVFAFEHGGLFGARDRDDYVVVDCGPIAPDHLPAHGHGDILAFEWTVGGGRVIVDTGVFEYAEGERRARSRATSAHNTVTVDDADQCEFWGSFRVAGRARVRLEEYTATDDGFALEGSHDGFARLPGAPIHRRSIDASPRRLRVSDRVEGGAGQAVRARLLLSPGLAVERTSYGARLGGAARAVDLRTAADLTVVSAPWFPDFGVELETVQIVLDYGAAPCEGGFTLEAT